MHARGGLFGNSLEVRGHARPAFRLARQFGAQQIEDDAPFLRIIGRIEFRNVSLAFEFGAFMHEQRGVAAVIDDQIRSAAIRPLQGLGSAPPILLERLTLPGKDRDSFRIVYRAAGLRTSDHNGRGSMILCRKNIAAHPPNIGAQVGQRLDEDGSLHGHVQRSHDARAGQRLRFAILLANGHESGHLVFGQADLVPAESCETEVANLERFPPRRACSIKYVSNFECSGHAIGAP